MLSNLKNSYDVGETKVETRRKEIMQEVMKMKESLSGWNMSGTGTEFKQIMMALVMQNGNNRNGGKPVLEIDLEGSSHECRNSSWTLNFCWKTTVEIQTENNF